MEYRAWIVFCTVRTYVLLLHCAVRLVSQKKPPARNDAGRHLRPQQVFCDGDEQQKETRHKDGLEQFVVVLDKARKFSKHRVVVVIVGIGIKKRLVQKGVHLVQDRQLLVVIGACGHLALSLEHGIDEVFSLLRVAARHNRNDSFLLVFVAVLSFEFVAVATTVAHPLTNQTTSAASNSSVARFLRCGEEKCVGCSRSRCRKAEHKNSSYAKGKDSLS
mmetsp:Transcript_9495/g.19010  ORF Transcript_9495/g.19010 Transcript_9495/m.19010 type:complete len:218 (+) Transcript_9495:425-1078(+)